MNVYQRLLKARAMFINADPKKSGKNMQLAFKYFELDDIVPIATKIFEEVGLISLVSFEDEIAYMEIVNIDEPTDSTTFKAPFKPIDPIVSNAGKQVTNEMQALGSSITYMRRYLYMIALDICEPDGIDVGAMIQQDKPTTPTQVQAQSPTTPTPAPVTKVEDKPLTSSKGNASALQIKQMKELLKKLRELDNTQENYIAEIAVSTKGFTEVSKADCEKLIIEITNKIERTN